MALSLIKASLQEERGGRGLSPIYLDAVDEVFENVVVMKRRNGRRRDAGDWPLGLAGECDRAGWAGREYGQRPQL